MTALLFVVALLAQPDAGVPSTRTVKVRVLHGEAPAPADTEVRLFRPSRLCGTAQYLGAPMRTPDAQGWVTFEDVDEGSSIGAQHRALGSVGLGGEGLAGPGPFTLRFPVGLPLSGRVVDAKGRPQVRARVSVVSLEPDHPRRIVVTSPEDGSFLFGNLKKGKWLVLADAFDDVWSPAVEVEAGTTKLDVTLPARAWFSGRVFDGAGKPLEEPWLHVETVGLGDEMLNHDFPTPKTADDVKSLKEPTGDAANPRKFRKAFGGDAEGRFELFVPTTQPVEVWADGPDGSCAITPRVKLVEGQPVELRLPAPATLALKVTDTKKQPLSKVQLTLRGDGTPGQNVSCHVRTAELVDGMSVPTAYKSMEISASFHAPVTRRLALVPGKPFDLGTVQLTPAARVAGRVLDRDGQPAGYIDVWLGGVEIATTDGDGEFEADGLAPGRKEISAKGYSGARSAAQKIELVVGQQTLVELKMK